MREVDHPQECFISYDGDDRRDGNGYLAQIAAGETHPMGPTIDLWEQNTMVYSKLGWNFITTYFTFGCEAELPLYGSPRSSVLQPRQRGP